MCDVVQIIEEELKKSTGDYIAIEMTPRFHLKFMEGILRLDSDHTSVITHAFGLPIIFVHGDPDHFKLLDHTEYRLRTKHNALLESYRDKNNRLNRYINNSYKIHDIEKVKNDLIVDLKGIVLRLQEIEQQIVTA